MRLLPSHSETETRLTSSSFPFFSLSPCVPPATGPKQLSTEPDSHHQPLSLLPHSHEQTQTAGVSHRSSRLRLLAQPAVHAAFPPPPAYSGHVTTIKPPISWSIPSFTYSKPFSFPLIDLFLVSNCIFIKFMIVVLILYYFY